MIDYNQNDLKNGAWDRVLIARKLTRFRSSDIIEHVFDSFFELHGDRGTGDDKSLVGGIAMLDGEAVTVISQQKGKTIEEMEYRQYGMTKPEGFRKSLRLMKQAEKFQRPILCFIDTPGAYPGVDAEKHGQAEAIARSLFEMANFTVPIISVVIGEGGSGGALALGVANKVLMMENAIYSVVSPEGCASILHKDSKKANIVANDLKLTAYELKKNNIVDMVISEEGHVDETYKRIKKNIIKALKEYKGFSGDEMKSERISKFRSIGGEVLFN